MKKTCVLAVAATLSVPTLQAGELATKQMAARVELHAIPTAVVGLIVGRNSKACCASHRTVSAAEYASQYRPTRYALQCAKLRRRSSGGNFLIAVAARTKLTAGR